MMSLLLGLILASGHGAPVPPVPPEPPDPPEIHMALASSLMGEGAYLGVILKDVDADTVKAMHLKEERGALVSKVVEDSPAAKAGLKKDDVIQSLNGHDVESAAQLRRMMGEAVPGRTARLDVMRGGRELNVAVTLGKPEGPSCCLLGKGAGRGDDEVRAYAFRLKGDSDKLRLKADKLKELAEEKELESLDDLEDLNDLDIEAPHVEKNIRIVIGGRARLGVKLDELTPQLAEYFGLKDRTGVLVTEVMKDTPAEKAGLKAGDILLMVGGDNVEDPGDVREALGDKEGTVELTVLRDKKEVKLSVDLEKSEKPRPRHSQEKQEHHL